MLTPESSGQAACCLTVGKAAEAVKRVRISEQGLPSTLRLFTEPAPVGLTGGKAPSMPLAAISCGEPTRQAKLTGTPVKNKARPASL